MLRKIFYWLGTISTVIGLIAFCYFGMSDIENRHKFVISSLIILGIGVILLIINTYTKKNAPKKIS